MTQRAPGVEAGARCSHSERRSSGRRKVLCGAEREAPARACHLDPDEQQSFQMLVHYSSGVSCPDCCGAECALQACTCCLSCSVTRGHKRLSARFHVFTSLLCSSFLRPCRTDMTASRATARACPSWVPCRTRDPTPARRRCPTRLPRTSSRPISLHRTSRSRTTRARTRTHT